MSAKPKVRWTQREQDEVFAAAKTYREQGGLVNSSCLSAAQTVLPPERRMGKTAFYPSSRAAKEFKTYLALATKKGPQEQPSEKKYKPTPAQPEPNESLSEHVRRLASALADEIARQVEAHLSVAVRRLTEDLASGPIPKSGAKVAARKVVVVGVDPSKCSLLRERFAGRLDLRCFDQDQHARLQQVAQSWRGTTVVMANLVAHYVTDQFKDSDLWRVNSFDELNSALVELSKEQQP